MLLMPGAGVPITLAHFILIFLQFSITAAGVIDFHRLYYASHYQRMEVELLKTALHSRSRGKPESHDSTAALRRDYVSCVVSSGLQHYVDETLEYFIEPREVFIKIIHKHLIQQHVNSGTCSSPARGSLKDRPSAWQPMTLLTASQVCVAHHRWSP